MGTGKGIKKITNLAITVICLLVILVIGYNYLTSYGTAVSLNWGIRLPRGYDMAYSESDKGSFGDGVRFTVLHYKTGIRNSFLEEFSKETNESMEKQVLEHLRNLNIDGDFTIDFNLPYHWKVVSFESDSNSIVTRAIYLVYQPHQRRLYIVEFKV